MSVKNVVVALVPLFALVGCDVELPEGQDTGDTGAGEDTGAEETPIDEEPTLEPHLRVAHMMPGVGTVDVLINRGEFRINGIEPGGASEYIRLGRGQWDLHVVPAGGEIEDTIVTIGNLGLRMPHNTSIAMVNPQDTSELDINSVDDEGPLPDRGLFRLQFIHAAEMFAGTDIALWDVTDPENPTYFYDTRDDFEDFGDANRSDFETSGYYELCLDVGDNGSCEYYFTLPDMDGREQVNAYLGNTLANQPYVTIQYHDGQYEQIWLTPGPLNPNL